MKIGHFSKLSNMTIKMLRHYDEIHLLKPSIIDEKTGYRYYTAEQLVVANKIQQLKQLGFSLTEMKELIEHNDDAIVIQSLLKTRAQELEIAQTQLTIQQQQLSYIQNIFKAKDAFLTYNVLLKTIPKRTVMSIKREVNGYEEEGQLWNELYDAFTAQHVTFAQPPLGMTIYHDNEYKKENMLIEVQSSIIGTYQNTASVSFFEAEEELVASVIFAGSYDQMPYVAEAVAFWMEEQDYELAGPMLNIAHVSPAQTDNPEKWVTEACYVIKKKEG